MAAGYTYLNVDGAPADEAGTGVASRSTPLTTTIAAVLLPTTQQTAGRAMRAALMGGCSQTPPSFLPAWQHWQHMCMARA